MSQWGVRGGANTDPKIRIIRAGRTATESKYGRGGLPKKQRLPKIVSLPKTPWDEKDNQS